MKKVCIEGWRNINHSYAMVNQWQLFELVKSPVYLRHKDIPYYMPTWNAGTNSSGFSEEQKKIIASINEPSLHESFDVTYRINYPYNISPSTSDKLFVFGTAEYQSTRGMFLNGDPQDVDKKDGLTIVTPSQWSKVGFLRAGFESDN